MPSNYLEVAAIDASADSLKKIMESTYDIVLGIKTCVSVLEVQHYDPIDHITDELERIAVVLDDCSDFIGALSDTLEEILQVYLTTEENAEMIISGSIDVSGHLQKNGTSDVTRTQLQVSGYISKSLVYEPWLVELAFENE